MEQKTLILFENRDLIRFDLSGYLLCLMKLENILSVTALIFGIVTVCRNLSIVCGSYNVTCSVGADYKKF